MLGIVCIALVLGSLQLTVADNSLPTHENGAMQSQANTNATSPIIRGVSLSPSNRINVTSTTPSMPSSFPAGDVQLTVLPTKTDVLSSNLTKITKSDGGQNTSSLEFGPSQAKTGNTNTVMTEGGNNVNTLDTSGTNFEGASKSPSKTVIAEGGVVESAGERVTTSSTAVPLRPELDPHSAIIEGMSSMKEGKIIARKGVALENVTVSNNEVHKPIEIVKNVSFPNGNSSVTRKPKPAVTDDGDESISDYIRKMDYIIPIVCTVFSVPLLIVLAIYLYKRGADLWERRHYNRMDFLIEGIYNE
ncbi:uncharacterized protein LOC124161967 [Ischnura elegans]|uniref:uncharacterized protein LOC124161967 n=1 Tax=Ischnura elegans TaxID=197161 RepID=UPI001ED88295|nr:uncharacterized protein LOC124161967 [Ischnura elegans]